MDTSIRTEGSSDKTAKNENSWLKMQCNNKNKNNVLIKYTLHTQNTQTGLILYTHS